VFSFYKALLTFEETVRRPPGAPIATSKGHLKAIRARGEKAKVYVTTVGPDLAKDVFHFVCFTPHFQEAIKPARA
jgi:hypothetical protein